MNKPSQHTHSIHFDGVGLRYGRGEEILKDINMSLLAGSLNFITGPSGAGKTSLLKLVYLHMRPSRGLITIFGQDTSQLAARAIPKTKRRMGVVLQDFQLVDHLSVFENVALPLRIRGLKRQTYGEDVISLLQWVGLGKRLYAFPPTLSGGEKQRVAIARAVIGKPDILIADEPTGNVDDAIGKRLMRLFFELNRLGTTVLIATHNHDLIPKNADIYKLDNGTFALETDGHG